MSILDTLAAAAAQRCQRYKEILSADIMQQKALSLPKKHFEFEKALRGDELRYICEVKKASPSKGLIAESFPYTEIAREYESAGAAAVSVLTEPDYFQGSDRYLREISQNISLPVIRKDFTVDSYMIYQAAEMGASAVLLICALLDRSRLREYIGICDSLGMSALVEAHTEQEVEMALEAGSRLIGVNNRNLKDFTVDLNTCIRLRRMVPDSITFVAESGIRTPEDIQALRQAGVNAVLIGETLMRAGNKAEMLRCLNGGTDG